MQPASTTAIPQLALPPITAYPLCEEDGWNVEADLSNNFGRPFAGTAERSDLPRLEEEWNGCNGRIGFAASKWQ